ncbi:MAG: hypothetical protein LCH32_00200 [Bacteroidetes bacterium]|nr:hypothetical protein [Bacteroidota bacterium]
MCFYFPKTTSPLASTESTLLLVFAMVGEEYKKAMVTGTNTELNETVTNAIKQMDLWNPTVKNGITVKSEVRFTLKYNKDKKDLIP